MYLVAEGLVADEGLMLSGTWDAIRSRAWHYAFIQQMPKRELWEIIGFRSLVPALAPTDCGGVIRSEEGVSVGD